MPAHVIVWDIETVPDLRGFAAANGLTGRLDDEVRAEMGDKFPKLIYHSIVCIGALVAQRQDEHWAVLAVGAPNIGERPEREIISAFANKIAELAPQLVNGASFDLPVLRYRAMVCGVAAPGLAARPYFNRYSEDAIDLCDVLSSFSSQSKPSLHELCRIISGATLFGSPVLGLWMRMPTVSGPNALSLDVLADPEVRLSLTPRSGPIVIEIEYRIDPAKARLFYAVMQHVQLSRQRNGAYGWSIARDIADPELWTERFHCPTWHDYLRQRSRSTASEPPCTCALANFISVQSRSGFAACWNDLSDLCVGKRTRPIDQPRMSHNYEPWRRPLIKIAIIAFALYDRDKWPTFTAPAARDFFAVDALALALKEERIICAAASGTEAHTASIWVGAFRAAGLSQIDDVLRR